MSDSQIEKNTDEQVSNVTPIGNSDTEKTIEPDAIDGIDTYGDDIEGEGEGFGGFLENFDGDKIGTQARKVINEMVKEYRGTPFFRSPIVKAGSVLVALRLVKVLARYVKEMPR